MQVKIKVCGWKHISLWYRAMLCGTVQCFVVPCNALWYRAMLCGTVQCFVVPCNVLWYCAIFLGYYERGTVAVRCGTQQHSAQPHLNVLDSPLNCSKLYTAFTQYLHPHLNTTKCSITDRSLPAIVSVAHPGLSQLQCGGTRGSGGSMLLQNTKICSGFFWIACLPSDWRLYSGSLPRDMTATI